MYVLDIPINLVLKSIDHITFINPGSVRFPEGRIYIPTYCIYENNQCDFYNAKTFEKIDDIFTPKKKISLFQKLFKNKELDIKMK